MPDALYLLRLFSQVTLCFYLQGLKFINSVSLTVRRYHKCAPCPKPRALLHYGVFTFMKSITKGIMNRNMKHTAKRKPESIDVRQSVMTDSDTNNGELVANDSLPLTLYQLTTINNQP